MYYNWVFLGVNRCKSAEICKNYKLQLETNNFYEFQVPSNCELRTYRRRNKTIDKSWSF